MKNIIDLTGMRFGRLTVIGIKGKNTYGKYEWNCQCDCGNTTITTGCSLHSGNTSSCGCFRKETAAENSKKYVKKYNKYSIDGKTVHVKFRNCNEEMLCDIEDWENLKEHCWYKDSDGYARAYINKNSVKFHALIMDCPNGFVRDHINRNRVDNRKCNLRIATLQMNAANRNMPENNTSGYIGVTHATNAPKWVAQIGIGGYRKTLGNFETKEKAASARKAGEEKYFAPLFG